MNLADAISRLKQMADEKQLTWNLSDNDQIAIRMVLDRLDGGDLGSAIRKIERLTAENDQLRRQLVGFTLAAQQVADIPQPAPRPSDAPATWDLLKVDLENRVRMGEKKYGVKHQPFNGRDNLRYLLEELIDSVFYLRAEIYQRDGK